MDRNSRFSIQNAAICLLDHIVDYLLYFFFARHIYFFEWNTFISNMFSFRCFKRLASSDLSVPILIINLQFNGLQPQVEIWSCHVWLFFLLF